MQNKITPFYTAKNLINDVKIICDKFEIFIKKFFKKNEKKKKKATHPLDVVSIGTIRCFGGFRF